MSARPILIVEDNPKIRSHVEGILRTAGYDVVASPTSDDFLRHVRTARFSLYVVDLGLGDADGRELIQQVRQSGDETPVLILSADSQIDSKVSGLLLGADDYLTKPFHPRELVSRVVALMRRAGLTAGKSLFYGGLQLDEDSHEVAFEGRAVRLTRSEARALAALMKAAGRTVRRDALQSRLNGNEDVSDYAVDKTVSRLRKALETVGSRIVIRTAKGLGYSLADAAEVTG